MLHFFRIVFGLPVAFGAAWVLFRRSKQVKGWIAACLFAYGLLYIVVFHYLLKAF